MVRTFAEAFSIFPVSVLVLFLLHIATTANTGKDTAWVG